jgi:imidazolonepropionase-like amidohydrolase
VAAHCHPPTSIARAAQLGVRTIEHATLIDEASAAAVKAAGAFVVPTLVIVNALLDAVGSGTLPAWAVEKLKEVSEHSLKGLELMAGMDLKIGFGTDLLGNLHVHQTREFTLRREVQPAVSILRSATSINADMLGEPTLGRIAPGCEADILIVEGDPMRDIGVLAKDGRGVRAIMKAGRFHKRDG